LNFATLPTCRRPAIALIAPNFAKLLRLAATQLFPDSTVEATRELPETSRQLVCFPIVARKVFHFLKPTHPLSFPPTIKRTSSRWFVAQAAEDNRPE